MSSATVLQNRYELKRRFFSEGNQAAYAARDRVRGEDVLLFLIPPQKKVSADMDRAIRADIERSFGVSSPSLLPLLDLRDMGDYRFLVMPMPRGSNAWARITKKTRARKFTPDEVVRAGDDLITAAEAAHAESTTLGFSPKQVWIGEDGSAQVQFYWLERIQLTGDEALAADGSFTTLGVEGGYFRAPELAQGRSGAAPPADQFFISAILYGLLTGEVPGGTLPPIRRVRKDVPATLANAIQRGLARDPKQRHESLAAFRQALHRRPARLGYLVPLLLLLLGLWAGRALVLGGAGLDAWAFAAETESRRQAAFERSRPEAEPVAAPSDAAKARYPGRYASANDEHRLALEPDGSFSYEDRSKDPRQRHRGLWWVDKTSDGIELMPAVASTTSPGAWSARIEEGRLVVTPPNGTGVPLEKTEWFAASGARVPLIVLDEPLEGRVLSRKVGVRGNVALPGTVLAIGGEDVAVDGTRFEHALEAESRGPLAIALEAVDPHGFRARLQRDVRIDDGPPEIAVERCELSQRDGTWHLEVSGRCSDDAAGGTLTVKVNGEDVALADGRFEHQLEGAPALAHAFTEIVAVDDVGRAARRVLWPRVVPIEVASFDARLDEVKKAIAAADARQAMELLEAIRADGGRVEKLPAKSMAFLVARERSPNVVLDGTKEPPAYYEKADVALTGRVEWFLPGDRLLVAAKPVEVDEDGRFETPLTLALGKNAIELRIIRAGTKDVVRKVELRLAGEPPSWLGQVSEAQRKASAELGLPIGREIDSFRFVLIPPNRFLDEPLKDFESIEQPFYLQTTETTRGQCKQHGIELESSWSAKSGKLSLGGNDHPAAGVTRDEAMEVAQSLGGARVRLPTDDEWEFAARAGLTGDTYWGGRTTEVEAWANFADAALKRKLRGWPPSGYSADVDDGSAGPWSVDRSKTRANAFGLRDMLGNVAEMTGVSGGLWIIRGGGWRNPPGDQGFSKRTGLKVGERAPHVGFRLLLVAEEAR